MRRLSPPLAGQPALLKTAVTDAQPQWLRDALLRAVAEGSMLIRKANGNRGHIDEPVRIGESIELASQLTA
jgi:hypothetical protein